MKFSAILGIGNFVVTKPIEVQRLGENHPLDKTKILNWTLG